MKKKKTLYNSPWYCTSCGLLNDQSSTWACMKCGAGKPALSVELAGWDYRAARKVGDFDIAVHHDVRVLK